MDVPGNRVDVWLSNSWRVSTTIVAVHFTYRTIYLKSQALAHLYILPHHPAISQKKLVRQLYLNIRDAIISTLGSKFGIFLPKPILFALPNPGSANLAPMLRRKMHTWSKPDTLMTYWHHWQAAMSSIK